jgi:hypothetical protein
MALTLLSGRASNVSLGSDYSYAATAQHGPVAIKNQLVSMRLDGKPVMFRTRTLPSITDGDQVAAAGTEKNGTLEALAVRNITTSASYHPPTTMVMALSAVLIVMGIATLWIFVGFFFVGFGALVLYRAMRIRKAVALLQQPGTPLLQT